MFSGRTLLIATKHGKEAVLAPLFERSMGVRCVVPSDLNTDLLGTFTGEVERRGDPLSVARQKCQLALERVQADFALASEGSFGPHPTIGFVPAGDELVLLLDRHTGREFFARDITTETNFRAAWISRRAELESFLSDVKFPSHAVIMRPSKDSAEGIIKDILSFPSAWETYERLSAEAGGVWVETDMRAMHNPTRMKSIERAGQKLVDKILSACPSCQAPGFSVTAAHPGLPCAHCGLPTRSTRAFERICEVCGFSDEIPFPHGKHEEDPMYCDFCNP